MKKKILVSGSSGFVGKKVVAALRERGHSVREFDLDNGQDILKLADCEKAVKGLDLIVHGAAILDENSPILWQVNVNGTENLIKAASEAKVDRFIHLSTAGVHGNQHGKLTEKSAVQPVTAYEKSKAAAEKIVEDYQEMIESTIIRPAIVLGANAYWKKIVRLMQKDFPLIGSGANKWQTVYIDDLVSAIVFCAEHDKTAGETFIVAEEKALSLEWLCVELKKELGLEPKIWKIPFWLGKILAYLYIIVSPKSLVSPAHLERLKRNRNYSISKIKRFGWKPKFTTEQGIKRIVKELRH